MKQDEEIEQAEDAKDRECECHHKDNPVDEQRRSFLMKISLAFGAFAAFAVGTPVLSALLAPLFNKKGQAWRHVGKLDDFQVGKTRIVTFENADPQPWAGTTARTAAWIRREQGDKLIAFSANCTHLGCPVRWEADAELFMCPCHGGVYYRDGTVAAGPPPKRLNQYQTRISNGNVEVMTAPIPLTKITD